MASNPTRVKLANIADIPPGKALIVKGPEGLEVALFNMNGKISALENVCPHMGGPLGEGEIENGMVTCPWHGWQFDICSGSCENMPGEEARRIPIEVVGEEIFLVQD